MAHIIDATGTAGYKMREGDGPAACLEKDGNYQLLLKAAKRNDKPSPKGFTTVNCTFVVQDSDAKGAVLYKTLTCEGKIESGPREGTYHVDTLIDLCNSCNREDLAAEIIGKSFDLDSLLAKLVGNGASVHCFARVIQEEDNRDSKMKSAPQFFMRQVKYTETQQSGANFRVNPRGGSAAKKPGVGAGTKTASNNAGRPLATDQMSGDV